MSTVLRVDADGVMLGALDRSAHVSSETPQAFSVAVLQAAYDAATDDELEMGTECLELVRRHCSIKPRLRTVNANTYWKITYAKDWCMLDALLRRARRKLLRDGPASVLDGVGGDDVPIKSSSTRRPESPRKRAGAAPPRNLATLPVEANPPARTTTLASGGGKLSSANKRIGAASIDSAAGEAPPLGDNNSVGGSDDIPFPQ